MKNQYITIVGLQNYHGKTPFQIGRKIRCVKEPKNIHDGEAIRVETKEFGTVGYVANSSHTVALGTKSAGAISHKMKKKFKVKVMFVTGSKIICKVVDGWKKAQDEHLPLNEEDALSF